MNRTLNHYTKENARLNQNTQYKNGVYCSKCGMAKYKFQKRGHCVSKDVCVLNKSENCECVDCMKDVKELEETEISLRFRD